MFSRSPTPPGGPSYDYRFLFSFTLVLPVPVASAHQFGLPQGSSHFLLFSTVGRRFLLIFVREMMIGKSGEGKQANKQAKASRKVCRELGKKNVRSGCYGTHSPVHLSLSQKENSKRCFGDGKVGLLLLRCGNGALSGVLVYSFSPNRAQAEP